MAVHSGSTGVLSLWDRDSVCGEQTQVLDLHLDMGLDLDLDMGLDMDMDLDLDLDMGISFV